MWRTYRWRRLQPIGSTTQAFNRHSVAPWQVAGKSNLGVRGSRDIQIERKRAGIMRMTFLACAAAASFSISAIAVPTTAHADRSGAVAAGVIGGLALGAMIGAAAANNGPYYPYAPPAAYYGPGSPGCYWQSQRVWNGFMWRRTRIYVCY
jgi:hypothetical protein